MASHCIKRTKEIQPSQKAGQMKRRSGEKKEKTPEGKQEGEENS